MRYFIVFLATFIYLCLEVALNYKLLNTVGVYSTGFDVRDIEVVGRSLSAFGAVLFVWMFFVKKSSFNLGFLKVRVRLLGLIAAFFLIYPVIFPIFYNGIEKVVDKVAESSDADARLNAIYSNLFRQGFLVGKYPLPKEIDPNSPEAKTYFSLLSYYSYGYGDAKDYDKLVADSADIYSLNADLSATAYYPQYQRLSKNASQLWDKYDAANKRYNSKVLYEKSRIRRDYERFIEDVKGNYSSGMREIKSQLGSGDSKLLRYIAKEEIWSAIRVESYRLNYTEVTLGTSPSAKWKEFNEAVFKSSYELIAKSLRSEAGFSSQDVKVEWKKHAFDLRTTSCRPEYSGRNGRKRIVVVQHRGWTDGDKPTRKRYISGDYKLFSNWKHMGYSHGGNSLVCNVSDRAFDSFYYNVLYEMIENKYGIHPYKHRTWAKFSNDPDVSARIVKKLPAEYREALPAKWLITDYATLKKVADKKISSTATNTWEIKASSYSLGGLKPNLKKREFFSSEMVEGLLSDASYGMYYASMPQNLNEKEFRDSVLARMVRNSVKHVSTAHNNPESLVSNDNLSEFGMSSVKAFIVPVIALLLSLAMVVINIASLSFMVISSVKSSKLKKGLVCGLAGFVLVFSGYVFLRPNPMVESPLYTRLYEHKKETNPVIARVIHGLFLLQPVMYGFGEKVYPAANALVFEDIIENKNKERNDEISSKINSIKQ